MSVARKLALREQCTTHTDKRLNSTEKYVITANCNALNHLKSTGVR